MILAAGLLVLLGLGLFVGGIVTGLVALYWGCVAACGLAAVLLAVARLRMAREAGDFDRRAAESASRAGTTTSGPATGTRLPEAPHTAPQPVVDPEPAEAATAAPAGATALRAPEAGPEPAGATALRAPEAGAEPAGATALRTPEAGPEPEPPVQEPPATVPPTTAEANGHADEHIPARRGAHEPRESPTDATTGEPGEEDVEVTDLLLVVDLGDEVLVVDEHPRYHLAGCPFLDGRDVVGLPMVEARADGFTPCATCRPVRHLADTERSRRQAARGN